MEMEQWNNTLGYYLHRGELCYILILGNLGVQNGLFTSGNLGVQNGLFTSGHAGGSG